jgi:hypothetical protein
MKNLNFKDAKLPTVTDISRSNDDFWNSNLETLILIFKSRTHEQTIYEDVLAQVSELFPLKLPNFVVLCY